MESFYITKILEKMQLENIYIKFYQDFCLHYLENKKKIYI